MFPVMYINENCFTDIKNNSNFQNNFLPRLIIDISSYTNEKQSIYVDKENKYFCDTIRNGYMRYIEIMCEGILGLAIDLDRKTLCDLVVLKPKQNEALLINKGTNIEIIEIHKKHVFPLIDIGDKVFEHTKLCYIITKKYEVRSLRSLSKGIVFYIGEVVLGDTPSIIIMIAGEDNIIRITRSC